MTLLRELTRFAVDLTGRSDRKLEGRGVFKVFADKNLRIDLFELNVLVTRDFELLCHHARVGHRKRSRPASLCVLARRGQEFQYDVLGMTKPRIVIDAAPHD